MTQRPPVYDMWCRFRDHKLQDLTLSNIENDHNLLVTAQDLFLSGFTAALFLFQQTLHGAKSSDDFTAKMDLIEAELQSYGDDREEGNGRLS